jgi:hypothetical protein
MAKRNELLAILDAAPLAKALAKRSRLRFAGIDARGVPAILLGVAAIVAARGVSAALYKAVAVLPESLREAREFWLALRPPREMLPQATVTAAGP